MALRSCICGGSRRGVRNEKESQGIRHLDKQLYISDIPLFQEEDSSLDFQPFKEQEMSAGCSLDGILRNRSGAVVELKMRLL